ncbi:unnamed protein product [Heligmosomoides polygyrus]|uniref:Uncharacterized protein n=1 Tax=Heligmosomoides polygyrus TaxID=6339 RepID=A0A3P8AMM0_HELPZ|nr:unnamed protein product [Heligmosomoides polygyrus]
MENEAIPRLRSDDNSTRGPASKPKRRPPMRCRYRFNQSINNRRCRYHREIRRRYRHQHHFRHPNSSH